MSRQKNLFSSDTPFVFVLCLQYIIWTLEVKGRSKAGLSRENGEVEEDVFNHNPWFGTTYEAGENTRMGWENFLLQKQALDDLCSKS